jgi:hypothetical protein
VDNFIGIVISDDDEKFISIPTLKLQSWACLFRTLGGLSAGA